MLNKGNDNHTIYSIDRTTIGCYYPDEDVSSWDSQEYQTKYNLITEKLRREYESQNQARIFAQNVSQIIQQDFPRENIKLSSIFRSRPTHSQEWSNIGIDLVAINKTGHKKSVRILMSHGDIIQEDIALQIANLIQKEEDNCLILVDQRQDAV